MKGLAIHLPPPHSRLTKFALIVFLSIIALVYACQKDFRHEDEANNPANDPAAVSRATQAEIAAFIDSIPDTLINRHQRVLALMTYEEIKRRNPAVSNYGRPLWSATNTSTQQPDGTYLSLTPIVVSLGGQVEAPAILAVETDSVDCRYWVFTPTVPDSLLSASDRDGEVAGDFETCMQECLCPTPAGDPNALDWMKCFFKCLFRGRGGAGGTIWVGGAQISGFVNRGTYGMYGNNGNDGGNGNNGNNNNNGSGNGSLSNYNFNQTAYDVYDKYYDCIKEHPDLSTAVWSKLYTPNGTMHCLSRFIDEALGMLCEEAQGQNITVAQFEEEFARAIKHFYSIARSVEGYVFPDCGLVGEVINFALKRHLTSEQFEELSLTEIVYSIQTAILSGVISQETGNRILDAALAFGATIDQVSFLIQHAQQNPSADFLETLIVNFGFENSPPPPTNPPISVDKPACQALFNFKIIADNSPGAPAPGSPLTPWKISSAALNEVYVEFDYSFDASTTMKVQEKIECIGFAFESRGGNLDCINSSASHAANILNNMISSTQLKVNSQYPPGLTSTQLSSMLRLDLTRNIIEAINFEKANSSCGLNFNFYAQTYNATEKFMIIHPEAGVSNCDVKMADCQ